MPSAKIMRSTMPKVTLCPAAALDRMSRRRRAGVLRRNDASRRPRASLSCRSPRVRAGYRCRVSPEESARNAWPR